MDEILWSGQLVEIVELGSVSETLVLKDSSQTHLPVPFYRWCPKDEESGQVRVLPSANKLFLKIRTSLNRCSRMISKGQTLLSVTQIFHVSVALWCKWIYCLLHMLLNTTSSICAQNLLDTYSAALLQRLPKTIHGQTSASPPLVGQDWYIRVTEEEELVRAYSCCSYKSIPGLLGSYRFIHELTITGMSSWG